MIIPTLLSGIGLRHPHYIEFSERLPQDIGWVEVHSENFFHGNTQAYTLLEKIATHYPLSLHGVGLSLGSGEALDNQHLIRTKRLMDAFSPFLISEHLAWNTINHHYLPDLIPIPYNEETLEIFCKHIEQAQDCLKRSILIENPSSYLTYNHSTISETEFLYTLSKRTGCGILLDVNNVYVSSMNHGWDPYQYIRDLPSSIIHEIHLAGHGQKTLSDGSIVLIDTHDTHVCNAVWSLYAFTVEQHGEKPTLIEWDDAIPSLDVLIAESQKMTHYTSLTTC